MTQADAEALLIAGYREQLEQYARAGAAVEEMTAALARGERLDALAPRLSAPMEEVARIAARLTPAKGVWDAEGYRAGPELRPVLDRLADAIRTLAERVGSLQRAAEARRDELWPAVENQARTRQMRRAYRGS